MKGEIMRKKMKILLVSYSDAGGGAFIGCYRLFCALQKFGLDVKLGVVEKRTNNDGVFELPKNKNFERQNSRRNKKNLLQTTNSILHSINKLSKIDVDFINKSDFDVVHLHWIAISAISIEDVAKIKKPIVWTMRDSWVFCGAEHYPNVLENDRRFIEGYTEGNFPKTSGGVDICRLTWERKRKAWKDKRFHFVALCNRHGSCLTDSALFKGQKATVIPNPIPDTFKQMNIREFKKYMNIPLNKKIIGFGAVGGRGVKGGNYLLKALTALKNKDDLHIVIFGDAQGEFIDSIKIQNTVLGVIFNEKILALIYNCLDCFVAPSLIETFCNTAHEAMHCGVPVCGFDVLGISECVVHKQTGYLAKPFNVNDLARGIEFCLANQKELSKNSLARARSSYFSEKQIVEKHKDVYKTAAV
jgi:glycosyltransferase involved in cell wall biosynthesis